MRGPAIQAPSTQARVVCVCVGKLMRVCAPLCARARALARFSAHARACFVRVIVCVRARVRACVRARARVWVCVCMRACVCA